MTIEQLKNADDEDSRQQAEALKLFEADSVSPLTEDEDNARWAYICTMIVRATA